MMDVAIPSTSRSAFSFLSFFLIRVLCLQFVYLETILHGFGPVHGLCKTRLKLKLNIMHCGAFPTALKFLLLLSSKM